MKVIILDDNDIEVFRHEDTLSERREHYEQIVNHYDLIMPSLGGYRSKLYIHKETGDILVTEWFTSWRNAPEIKFDDYRETVYRTYYGTDVQIYYNLQGLLTRKAMEYGLTIGSVHQKFEVENERYFLIPKDMNDLIYTLVRHVDYAYSYQRHTKLKIDDIYEYIEQMPKRYFLKMKRIPGPYADYVLTVNKPIFRRDADNTNKNTFDFIDIEMVVRSGDATKEKVKANQKEIFDKAINKLNNSKQFQKYGVPVNFLKMYQFVIRKDGTLIISFCLKGE